MSKIPEPPEGFVLDSKIPEPPEGFVLDNIEDSYGPIRAGLQGPTFGFSDDIYGTYRGFTDDALIAKAKAKGISPTELGREEEYNKLRAYQEKYPGKAIGEEVLASFAAPAIGQIAGIPRWMSLLNRTNKLVRANPVASATGLAGVAGAGHSKPGGDDIVQDALMSAGLGGAFQTGMKVLGAAAPVVGEYFSAAIAPKAWAKHTGGRSGRNAVRQALTNDGVTDINAHIEDLIRSKKPLTLADKNPNTLGIMDFTKNHPGPGRTQVTNYLDQRDKMSLSRLNTDVDEVVGKGSYYDTMQSMIASRKGRANEHYTKAYSQQIPVNDNLVSILRTPAGKKALKDSYKLAGNERMNLPKVRFTDEGKLVTEQGGRIVAIDTRHLDFIKKSLDNEIGKMLNHASGKSGSSNTRAVIELKNQLLDLMDEVNPDYKTARNIFAGDKSIENAMESGRTILSEKFPEHVRDMVKAMSESEKTAYRMGAMNEIRDKFGGFVEGATVTNMAGNKTYNLLKNNKGVQSIRETFPKGRSGTKQFNSFMKKIGDEMDMKRAHSQVMAGSQTAERLATKESLLPIIQQKPLARMRENLNPGWRQGAKDIEMSEIARMLTTDAMDPAGLRALGKQLSGVEANNWMDPMGKLLTPGSVGLSANTAGMMAPSASQGLLNLISK
jgi:hypothetical protein